MKKQKGMTLIEVMVAMLVLSIAMIGGISFFTSAYRINYSYLESANRLDHALRYVEKLKIQRRNYPTKGYFPNMGGTGFTVFFVDSELYDTFADEPYFYEDNTTDIIKSVGKITYNSASNAPYQNVSTEKTSNTGYKYAYRTYYFTKKDMNSLGYSRDLFDYVENLYPNGDHLKQRLQLGMEALPADENGYKKIYESGDITGYMKYSYDPATKTVVEADVYYEYLFSRLLKAAKDTYNDDITYYKQYKNFRNTTTAFSLTSYYLYKVPYESASKPNLYEYRYHIYQDSHTQTSGGSNSQSAWGKYQSKPLSESNYIVLKAGAEVDGGEHTSNIGGVELTFDSTRFYSYGSNSINNNNELFRKVENVTVPTTNQITIAWELGEEARNAVKTPTASPYGSNVWFVAKVYKYPSGKEVVTQYHYWDFNLGKESTDAETKINNKIDQWRPSYIDGSIDSWVDKSGDTRVYTAQISPVSGSSVQNKNRVSKLRRSVYISLYSVPTKTEAENIIKHIEENCLTVINKNNNEKSIDLDKVIPYMTKMATPGDANYKGYKIIMIPFNQLYAQNEYSTLCERLD